MNAPELPVPRVRVVSFTPVRRGTLRGYATLDLIDLGITIRSVSVHLNPEGVGFIHMPRTVVRDNTGAPTREDGRVLHKTAIVVDGFTRWTALQQVVFAAVKQAYPEAFNDPPTARIEPMPDDRGMPAEAALPAFISGGVA